MIHPSAWMVVDSIPPPSTECRRRVTKAVSGRALATMRSEGGKYSILKKAPLRNNCGKKKKLAMPVALLGVLAIVDINAPTALKQKEDSIKEAKKLTIEATLK